MRVWSTTMACNQANGRYGGNRSVLKCVMRAFDRKIGSLQLPPELAASVPSVVLIDIITLGLVEGWRDIEADGYP